MPEDEIGATTDEETPVPPLDGAVPEEEMLGATELPEPVESGTMMAGELLKPVERGAITLLEEDGLDDIGGGPVGITASTLVLEVMALAIDEATGGGGCE